MVISIIVFFCSDVVIDSKPVQRRKTNQSTNVDQLSDSESVSSRETSCDQKKIRWKRILLLIIAITVHNIPGNLLVFITLYSHSVSIQLNNSN